MKLFGKDLDRDVVVVAEIGVNHEGSFEQAEKMLLLAADAGADAVKFQTYTPERYASASDPARLERVTRFCLSKEEFARLADVARARGIAFFSTPVTEDVVDFVAGIGDAMKVASGDVVFEPTVRGSARTGKPVIISTGNATLDEIDQAVGWCREEMGDQIKERLILLHCIAAYPTPIEQSNILSIPFLRDRYGLTTGYSSHVIEPEAVLAAVALGAQVIEVHFTDCREGRTFHDHKLSCDPPGLRRLIDSIGRVKASLGNYGKEPSAAEEPIRKLMRKGVVAARDLPAGTKLALSDMMFARPATEVPAAQIGALVGKTLTEERRRGEQLRWSGVE